MFQLLWICLVGGIFKESYRTHFSFIHSLVGSFISCFDVRISSFSLFIFVFLFYSLSWGSLFFSLSFDSDPCVHFFCRQLDAEWVFKMSDLRVRTIFSGLLNEGNLKLTSYKWFSIDQKINNGIQMTWQPRNNIFSLF